METSNHNKRFKWLLIVVMVAVMTAVSLASGYAKRVPLPQRGMWIIGTMALMMVPFGFIYGRNSARKDDLGKISRAFAWGAVACLLLGVALGRQWIVFQGLGIGLLAGFGLGKIAYKKSIEKHGDSLEADQYLNVTRSERLPKPERPAQAYLKQQDEPTQKLICGLYAAQVLAILTAVGLGLWTALAGYPEAIPRALFVRSGDGTRYFLTLDPAILFLPMMLLSIVVVGVASEVVIRRIAGPKEEIWMEYSRLTQRKARSAKMAKAEKVFAYVCLAIVLLVLVLYADCYVKVTDQGIAINRFETLGTKYYRWNQVRDVEVRQEPYVCQKGHTHTRLRVRISFTDGSEWVPDTSFARRAPRIEAAARYVARQKGL
jgi:hypothetical protein